MVKRRTARELGKEASVAAEPTNGEPTDLGEPTGPSPNPKTNLILADVALRGGGMLLREAVERGLLSRKYQSAKAQKVVKGRSVRQRLFGLAVSRIATRSVPGALIVGGGLLAKTLYDRRKARTARAEGEKDIQEMSEDGSET